MQQNLDEKTKKAIITALETGKTVQETANIAGVAQSTVYKYRREWLKNNAKGQAVEIGKGFLTNKGLAAVKKRTNKAIKKTDNPQALIEGLQHEIKVMIDTLEDRLDVVEGDIDSLEDAITNDYNADELEDRLDAVEGDIDSLEDAIANDYNADELEDEGDEGVTEEGEIHKGDVLDLGQIEKPIDEDEALMKLLVVAGGLYIALKYMGKTTSEEGW